uniref:Uncharacterized protein n=1 Tax=viral metagenome TaxID=1070528 RepID=A0A6C0EAV9_9ZZZZ
MAKKKSKIESTYKDLLEKSLKNGDDYNIKNSLINLIQINFDFKNNAELVNKIANVPYKKPYYDTVAEFILKYHSVIKQETIDYILEKQLPYFFDGSTPKTIKWSDVPSTDKNNSRNYSLFQNELHLYKTSIFHKFDYVTSYVALYFIRHPECMIYSKEFLLYSIYEKADQMIIDCLSQYNNSKDKLTDYEIHTCFITLNNNMYDTFIQYLGIELNINFAEHVLIKYETTGYEKNKYAYFNKFRELIMFFIEHNIKPVNKIYELAISNIIKMKYDDKYNLYQRNGYSYKNIDISREISDLIDLILKAGYKPTKNDVVLAIKNKIKINNIEKYGIKIDDADIKKVCDENTFYPYGYGAEKTNKDKIFNKMLDGKMSVKEVKAFCKDYMPNISHLNTATKYKNQYAVVSYFLNDKKVKPDISCILTLLRSTGSKLCDIYEEYLRLNNYQLTNQQEIIKKAQKTLSDDDTSDDDSEKKLVTKSKVIKDVKQTKAVKTPKKVLSDILDDTSEKEPVKKTKVVKKVKVVKKTNKVLSDTSVKKTSSSTNETKPKIVEKILSDTDTSDDDTSTDDTSDDDTSDDDNKSAKISVKKTAPKIVKKALSISDTSDDDTSDDDNKSAKISVKKTAPKIVKKALSISDTSTDDTSDDDNKSAKISVKKTAPKIVKKVLSISDTSTDDTSDDDNKSAKISVKKTVPKIVKKKVVKKALGNTDTSTDDTSDDDTSDDDTSHDDIIIKKKDKINEKVDFNKIAIPDSYDYKKPLKVNTKVKKIFGITDNNINHIALRANVLEYLNKNKMINGFTIKLDTKNKKEFGLNDDIKMEKLDEFIYFINQ